MWKGCFSMAAYDGIKMVLESIIGEVTSFEKYLTSFVYLFINDEYIYFDFMTIRNIEDANKSNKGLYGHFLLKM